MNATRAGCVVLVVALLSRPAVADPPVTKSAPPKSTPAIPAPAETARTAPDPKFVVYASEQEAEFASSMFRVLRGKDKVARFAKAQTIEKAAESQADVLVLVMTTNVPPKLEPATIEALKRRKILGIGAGAARLFGQLGLEINLGACAHFGPAPPDLTIVKSKLLGEPKSDKPIAVLGPAPEAEADAPPPMYDNFAVFLPPRNTDSSVIDVLARASNNLNYAPVVRQGNCMLIGIPVPATRWSEAYLAFIQDACLALNERKAEAFAAARRELTKPGAYKFKLAKGFSSDEAFDKTFYFRFTEATKITAQLEHSGSDNVMLLFMGQDPNENRLHWTRRDARNGETLEITADIGPDDIAALADRYWTLQVTNFGKNSGADCKVTIKFESP